MNETPKYAVQTEKFTDSIYYKGKYVKDENFISRSGGKLRLRLS